MEKTKLPHFTVQNTFQRRDYSYSDLLKPEILIDVSKRIAHSDEYTADFINTEPYNKGRLATLEYDNTVAYICFSDTEDAGRNSSFQSFPTALVQYYKDPRPQKKIYFYFLQSSGNQETDYHRFMYRLMATAGFEFLNSDDFLEFPVNAFKTVEDVIAARDNNRSRNRSNNPTYVTRSSSSVTEIYGKTYGASKKETTLLCIALSRIAPMRIELYVICEGNLTMLPRPDVEVIEMLGKVEVIPTDLVFERNELLKDTDLRLPRFYYNLFAKFGPKKCAFCECEIPELVQGAHIWTIADIKRQVISVDTKVEYANDGDNGLWLCENHHKMLDQDLVRIGSSGQIALTPKVVEQKSIDYITVTTPITQLTPAIFTDKFAAYIQRRYPA